MEHTSFHYIRLLLRRRLNELRQEYVPSLQAPSDRTRSQGHRGSLQSRRRPRDKGRNSVCSARNRTITAPRSGSVATGSSLPPPRPRLNSHFTASYILPRSRPSFCAPARRAAPGRQPGPGHRGRAQVEGSRLQPRRAGRSGARAGGVKVSRLPPVLKVNEGAAPSGGGGGGRAPSSSSSREPGSSWRGRGARGPLSWQVGPAIVPPPGRAVPCVPSLPPGGRAGWLCCLSPRQAVRERRGGHSPLRQSERQRRRRRPHPPPATAGRSCCRWPPAERAVTAERPTHSGRVQGERVGGG